MRVARVVAICAVFSVLWTQRADAFCAEQFGAIGQAVWKVPAVKYKISDNASEEVRAAIQAAFEAWGSVPCSTLTFEDAGGFPIASTDFYNPGKEAQIFFFWYDEANAASFPKGLRDGADLSQNLFYPFRGHDGINALTFGSIAMNAFYKNAAQGYSYEWATDGSAAKFDVQTVAMRVIGQAIGLTYSPAADSVMKRVLSASGAPVRELGADDIAAIQNLYADKSDPSCAAPVEPSSAAECAAAANDTTPPAGTGNPPPDTGNPPPPPVNNPRPDTGSGGTGGTDGTGGTGGAGGADDGAGGTGGTSGTGGSGSKDDDDDRNFGASGCASDSQCGDNEICAVDGRCVALGSKSGGGCAVVEEAPSETPTLWLTVLFALALSFRRGRRS